VERTLAPQEVAWLIATILFLLGVSQLMHGYVRKRMISGWVPGSAVVVRARNNGYGYVVFRWQDPQGQVHEATAQRGFGYFRAGTVIPILVDPSRPNRATPVRPISDGRLLTILGTVLLAAGVVAGVVGLNLSVLA
jgi:hypothetical protein